MLRSFKGGLIVLAAIFLPIFTGKGGDGKNFSEPIDSKYLEQVQVGGDEGGFNNPFTISAAVREEYDDNIFTSNVDRVDSFKTIMSPEILFVYPMDNTTISFSAGFDATYYTNRPDSDWDLGADFIGRVSHNFTERFNLDIREHFRYAQEPEIFNGSLFVLQRNGNYIANTASIQFSAEWTPLLSTVTAYTNEIWDYEDDIVASLDNNMNHTVNHDFRWAIWPTVTLVTGMMYQDYDYDTAPRDYDVWSGYVGADWAVSPTVLVGARGGVQLISLQDGSDDLGPYGEAYADWQIGAKSSLDTKVTYAFQDTDIATSYSQEALTFILGFDYQWTPLISSRLEGVVQYGQYESRLFLPGTALPSFDETVYGINMSAAYQVTNWLAIEAGYSFVAVSNSEPVLSAREYDRNRVWIGVRGTY